MQAAVTAVLWIAGGLLVASGLAKFAVPDGAMAALHRLRLPSGRVAARMLGTGEVVVGVGAPLLGGLAGAGVLALAYAALLGVAAYQRSRQLACGCFGTRATQVTRGHLAVDAVAVGAGLAGLLWAPRPVSAVLAETGPVTAVAALLLVGVAVLLVRAAVTSQAEAVAQ